LVVGCWLLVAKCLFVVVEVMLEIVYCLFRSVVEKYCCIKKEPEIAIAT